MSNYDLIPIGHYRARAKATKFGITRSGKEELTIQFTITDEQEQGRTVYGRVYFTEATEARALESLGYLGFTGDMLELCADVINDASTLLPNEVSVEVEHEKWQDGSIHDRVKWINSLYGKGGGAMKPSDHPLDARAKKEFAARMNAMRGKPVNGKPAPARAIGGGQGAKATPRTAPVNEADYHSDTDYDSDTGF